MIVSIFNDVIGSPVMRGPSSSHCAAALRIGRLARDLMDGRLDNVLVQFDRKGALPTTHETQGSDMGLFGGLLGWVAADERLPGSQEALRAAGTTLRIETVNSGDPHPNTYRLTLSAAGDRHSLRAISTGGGMIEVVASFDIDGWDSAAKTAALANVFLDAGVTPLDVDRRGIGQLTPERVEEMDRKGKTIVLVSRGRTTSNGPRLRVRAEVLDKYDILASVHGTSNILLIETDLMETIGTVSINPGVVQTAYGLFSDLVDIARSL